MKKNGHIASCLIALGLGLFSAQAQDSPELRIFQQKAGDRSSLFRGRQGDRYSFLANGHPYWSSTEFVRGNIVFEDRTYCDVMLNIDALTQKALVQLSNSLLSLALSPAQVSSIDIGEHHFIGVGPEDAGSLPEGFYEVFGQGPEQVYKHVDKALNSSVSNVNGDGIGYNDPNYREDILRYFQISRTYYFRDRDGRFSRIRGNNALIGKFPDRKKELRRAVRNLRTRDYDIICQEVLRQTAR
ncbi:MAG: hypothetical protein K5849_00510 [Bacteroidales bacterium]|nr:hypothetical protein [Bacteroidales bacterium]